MNAWRDRLFAVNVLSRLALLVVLAVAVMGVRSHWLDYRIGFGLLTLLAGPVLVLLGLSAGVGALALALRQKERPRLARYLWALAIPLAVGAVYASGIAAAVRAPPVHDVSTDRIDPPPFSPDVLAARAAVPGANDVEFNDTGAYVDLRSLRAPLPARQTYDLARNVARKQGWRILREYPQELRFEAEAHSALFGFVDDIAVRVDPVGASEALLDVRSASRVGVSDLGANAARIRAFYREVEATLRRAGAL